MAAKVILAVKFNPINYDKHNPGHKKVPFSFKGLRRHFKSDKFNSEDCGVRS